MNLLSLLVIHWTAVASLFTCAALLRLHAARPAHSALGLGSPREVLLLRPLDHPAPHELECLVPVEHPGLRIRQVVLAPAPPALPAGVEWLASDPRCPNRKVGHLVHALDALQPAREVAVLSVDADVPPTSELISALVAELEKGVELASVAWIPRTEGGLGGGMLRALLGATHHHFLALDALRLGPGSPSGKAMALGPRALALLREVSDRAGEDLELASRLHAEGRRVTLAHASVHAAVARDLSLTAALARVTRWMQVLRAHRPGLYPTVPLLLAPTPPLLALALMAGSAEAIAAWGVLALLRSLLGHRLSRHPFSWIAGEALLFAAFVTSLWSRKLHWRGRKFQLERGGRMVELVEAP